MAILECVVQACGPARFDAEHHSGRGGSEAAESVEVLVLAVESWLGLGPWPMGVLWSLAGSEERAIQKRGRPTTTTPHSTLHCIALTTTNEGEGASARERASMSPRSWYMLTWAASARRGQRRRRARRRVASSRALQAGGPGTLLLCAGIQHGGLRSGPCWRLMGIRQSTTVFHMGHTGGQAPSTCCMLHPQRREAWGGVQTRWSCDSHRVLYCVLAEVPRKPETSERGTA